MPSDQDFLNIRNRLFDELVLTGDLWAQYKSLFMTSGERVARLNEHAGWFFKTVQRAYVQQLVLSISRLTDPAESSGRRNVSVAALMDDPRLENREPFRTELAKMVSDVQAQAWPVRRHRNRAVAHLDHAAAFGYEPLPDFSLSLLGEVVAALGAIHNSYGAEILDRDASYEIYPMGSTDALVEALELASMRRERALRAEVADLE